MRPRNRIALFALALTAVFAAAVAVGSAFEPAETTSGSSHSEGGGGHAEAGPSHAGAAGGHGGESGLRLKVERSRFDEDEPATLRFSIAGADGRALTDFDELHERRLHLIVVRRDGTGFQHLHPAMDAAGDWTTPIRFAEAGAHRVFADFSVGGEGSTLATDLFVEGEGPGLRPFPVPRPTDETGGYVVRLDAGGVSAGKEAGLHFEVSREGRPLSDIEDYLGARGHLVVLREGDLAFLHAHPEDHGGEEIEFATGFPTSGRYRLYLQFKHAGEVRTAEFTVEVPR